MQSSVSIKDNIQRILDNISEVELRTGRSQGAVRLMAVSKFHSVSEIISATNAGQVLFGENRVQEAVSKFSELKISAPVFELHIIGSLQRNKVKNAVEIASCIQSLDRMELAVAIEKHAAAANKIMHVLIEFHTGEDSKSGFTSVDEMYKTMDYVFTECPHIRLDGFMTMAPLSNQISVIRNSFRKLFHISEAAKRRYPNVPLPELSMGMSHDYEIAIEEGSTMVRLGTAIFGPRENVPQ